MTRAGENPCDVAGFDPAFALKKINKKKSPKLKEQLFTKQDVRLCKIAHDSSESASELLTQFHKHINCK